MTPDDRKYAKTHEWVKIEEDVAIVGITDFAQQSLGDITFVELPQVGESVVAGEEFGVIESVKAASDLYAPLSGRVIEINTALEDSPEAINQDPYEDGWIIKLRGFEKGRLKELLSAPAYDEQAADDE